MNENKKIQEIFEAYTHYVKHVGSGTDFESLVNAFKIFEGIARVRIRTLFNPIKPPRSFGVQFHQLKEDARMHGRGSYYLKEETFIYDFKSTRNSKSHFSNDWEIGITPQLIDEKTYEHIIEFIHRDLIIEVPGELAFYATAKRERLCQFLQSVDFSRSLLKLDSSNPYFGQKVHNNESGSASASKQKSFQRENRKTRTSDRSNKGGSNRNYSKRDKTVIGADRTEKESKSSFQKKRDKVASPEKFPKQKSTTNYKETKPQAAGKRETGSSEKAENKPSLTQEQKPILEQKEISSKSGEKGLAKLKRVYIYTIVIVIAFGIGSIIFQTVNRPKGNYSLQESTKNTAKTDKKKLIGNWRIREIPNAYYMFNDDYSGIFYTQLDGKINLVSIQSFQWSLSKGNDTIFLTTQENDSLWVWDVSYADDRKHIIKNEKVEQRTLDFFTGNADHMSFDTKEEIASNLAAIKKSEAAKVAKQQESIQQNKTIDTKSVPEIRIDRNDLLTLWDLKGYTSPRYEFFKNGTGIRHDAWKGGRDPNPKVKFNWEIEGDRIIKIQFEDKREMDEWKVFKVSKNEITYKANKIYTDYTLVRHNLIVDDDVVGGLTSTANRPFNMQNRALRKYPGTMMSQTKLSPKYNNLIVPRHLLELINKQTGLGPDDFLAKAGFEMNRYRGGAGEKTFINVYDGSKGKNSYSFEDIYERFDFEGFVEYRNLR